MVWNKLSFNLLLQGQIVFLNRDEAHKLHINSVL